MADDPASQSQSTEADALEAIHDIRDALGKMLRESHLDGFIRNGDDLLRGERQDDSKTVKKIRRQQLEYLGKQLDTFLKMIEKGLPQTLELLFSDLRREFKESTTRSRFSAPLTPPTVSTELPRTTETIPNKTPPAAPSAPMTQTNLGFRLRDTTPPGIGIINDVETSVTDIGSPNATTALDQRHKRPLDSCEGASTSHAKKKAKRTPQTNKAPAKEQPNKNPIPLSECYLDKRECIFRYGKNNDLYVLRCNYTKCKERVGCPANEKIFFTSYPFRDGLAMKHFGGEGHSMKDENEVFRKYARKVTGATREYYTEPLPPQGKTQAGPAGPSRNRQERNIASPPANLSTPRDKGKQPERTSTSRNIASPPGISPSTSRDKGKQPERPLDHYWSRPSALEQIKGAAASASTPSKQQAKKDDEIEAFLDSSYKPNSLFSASIATDVDLPLSDEEPDLPELTQSMFVTQEDDDEFPRINSRGRTIPDYKEKPPSDEEFSQWQR
ncbi:hypothetical protein F5Y18DRAFT_391176 [Xylariaceae sp. FL1019]|nr:hypothetical protein F5Y18DRAFT_391176 [Xylariaceae sp. FL1019]